MPTLSPELRAALTLIHERGAPASDTPVENRNTSIVDALCRTAMRYPNPDTKQFMQTLRYCLSEFFKTKTDAQIQWLLNRAPESRGNFTTPDAVRAFCQASPESIQPSTESGLLDVLTSALNYGIFSPDTSLEEGQRNSLQTELRELATGAPRYIIDSPAFSKRSQAKKGLRQERKVKKSLTDTVEERFAMGYTRQKEAQQKFEESNGDRAISELSLPPEQAHEDTKADGNAIFTSIVRSPIEIPKVQAYTPTPGDLTDGAHRLGLETVGHASGSLPGSLSIANGLLRKYRGKEMTPEEKKAFAALVSASFHRSAFHSPLESYLGYAYYMNPDQFDAPIAWDDDTRMKKFFAQSIQLIASASDEEVIKATEIILDAYADKLAVLMSWEEFERMLSQDKASPLEPSPASSPSQTSPPSSFRLFTEAPRVPEASSSLEPDNDSSTPTTRHGKC